jgi:hypothetical protein
MRSQTVRAIGLVALWSAVSAAAVLVPLVAVGVAAGLGQWWILRSRLNLPWTAAVPFALSFPAGQFPSYLMYLVVYTTGFGGLDGPPEWFLTVALAGGGLMAGMCQFLGLPKSWKNLRIWIPATCLAWAVTALGDLNVRGMVVLSALFSGLVTGLAMLALSPRPVVNSKRRRADPHPVSATARIAGSAARKKRRG